jgi:ATP/maltotriose-dependent transcriptional regulator MalT
MGVIEDLTLARQAYERGSWLAAYDALRAVDARDMVAGDFMALGMSALLAGRSNDGIQAFQRGYQSALDAGDPHLALRCSFYLAMTLMESGETVIAVGWIGRARRLLEQTDDDTVEAGYLAALEMFQHIFTEQFEEALQRSDRVAEYAHRFDDADLRTLAFNARGRMLIYSGRVREGLALLDEAMVGVTLGEVTPLFAGETYCSLIEACQEVCDYGRAAEWTSALTRWIDAQPELVRFTGQCAVHRGQIMRARGAFADARREFDRALERYLEAGQPPAAALAYMERGDVRRIQGDLLGAESDLDHALELGLEPQPALALVWLAGGRSDAAVASIRRLLAEPRDPVHRVALLAPAVEVLLAVGDVDAAQATADDIAATAEQFGCRPLHAMTSWASGAVALARDDATQAVPELRRAFQQWQNLDAPYEAARCRELLGYALRKLGDADSADAEFAAARADFGKLGAPADAARVGRVGQVGQVEQPELPAGLTEREAQVLRLVAKGMSNAAIAADLSLSEKTVSRHLSNIFAKIGVSSRTAAAAFAFEHGVI